MSNKDTFIESKTPSNDLAVAVCKNCKIRFTTWIGGDNNCPECEGVVIFPIQSKDDLEGENYKKKFNDMFPHLYVRNNPSGGYFEIAPELIPNFISQEVSRGQREVIEKAVEEIEKLRMPYQDTEQDISRGNANAMLNKVIIIFKSLTNRE